MKKVWLKNALAITTSVAMTTGLLPVNALAVEPANAPDADAGYQLVWSDEFDGDGLNTDDWNVEQHEPGWVNAELQRYTSLDEGNIEVRDGNLVIKPHVTEPEQSEDVDEQEEAEQKFTDVSFGFDYAGETGDTKTLQINFGAIKDGFEDTAVAARVEISEISFKDTTDPENPIVISESFASDEGWFGGAAGDGAGSVSYEDGKAIIEITDPGTENWHFQIQKAGFTLEEGHHYEFSMTASSDVDRSVEISVLDNSNWSWYGGTKAVIEGSGSAAPGGSSSGQREITSGRITTQNKHDFTYGRFEARARVPQGQGYLPAFWLMATDEGLYGQWPKCGEIDIMEVMGQNLSTSYHTIHYGYSAGTGHKENQGRNSFAEGNLADEFHDYALEWDPGKITWFVDGKEVYSTSDWYTGTDDDNQVTYPAPFDQDFYIILNLAVGGSWVGYPTDDVYAQMNDQSYEIDYVRVYQKSAEEYERLENECRKPEKEPVTYREADENGNYVINGDFSKEIGMDGSADADKDNWKLHLEGDNQASTYNISNNGITLTPSVAGSQTYSVQLKQENIPMYRGWEYELTFDAFADEERDIVVDVEGPDRGWIRYMPDTTVRIGTAKQTYTYSFTMNEKSDPNGCLEFNLGKLGSSAPVTISNVKLSHKSGEAAQEENLKEIRPDGNYIYNGSFDQGEGRLGYWEIADEDRQFVSVTNVKNQRVLKVTVPENKTVKLRQSGLSPIGKGEYEISFLARMEEGSSEDGVTVNVSGEKFTPSITSSDRNYSKKMSVTQDKDRESSFAELIFDKAGTYYMDNVFLAEAALIKNGSFNAGLTGFAPYIYDTVKANYVVDNMNGNDNAFAITIEDTMADDAGNSWYVQLNQDGVPLEEGKSYRLSFKARSSIERNISYAMQEFEGNWTNYSGTGSVTINSEWTEFSHEFKMESPTDLKSRFNITMGSVDGVRITKKHDVFIDDILLVEIDEVTGAGGESGDDPAVEPGTGEGGDDPAVEPGTGEGGDDPAVEPGTGEGTDDPAVEPGTDDGGDDKPVKPVKPIIIPAPIVKIVAPVVKVVKKIVVGIFSILKRLFW